MDLGSIVGVPVSGIYGTYENDGAWGWLGQNMPLVPHVTADDQGDKYRTAAAQLDFGVAQVGLNLFTGDPGPATAWKDPGHPGTEMFPDGHLHYVAQDGTSPDKYRAGVAYLSIGGFRFGRNSEAIRNYVQNEQIHSRVGAPYFTDLGGDEPYWYFGTGTGNTLW